MCFLQIPPSTEWFFKEHDIWRLSSKMISLNLRRTNVASWSWRWNEIQTNLWDPKLPCRKDAGSCLRFFSNANDAMFFLLSVSGRRLPALWRFILQITVCCIRSYVYNVYYRYIYCDSCCTFSWRQSWPSCSSISWMSPLYQFWTQPLTSTESWNGGPGYSEEGAVTKRGWWCFVVLYMLVLCLQSLN